MFESKSITLNGRFYSEKLKSDEASISEAFGYDFEEQHLNTSNTAFMLIDVYGRGYDAGDPEPERTWNISKKLWRKEKEIITNKIKPAKDLAKRVGFPIIYVMNSYGKDDDCNKSEFGKLMKRTANWWTEDVFTSGNDAREYSKIIAPEPGEYLVRKKMYDGFFETCLDRLLRDLGIKNIIGVGFAANVCVSATLTGAYYRNYRVVSLRDCTLALEYPDTEDELLATKEAIRYIERLVGFTATFDEFKDACEKIANQ